MSWWRAGLAAAAVLAVSGCGSDLRGELRHDVAAVTAEANERDADGLRRAVDVLLGTLAQARAEGAVTTAEAGNIERIALAVQNAADLVDEELLRQQEEERQRQEEERRRAEEEAARQAAEEEAARKAAEEEARKQAEEQRKAEEEARKKAEEEAVQDDEDAQRDGEGGGNESNGTVVPTWPF